MTPYDFLQHLQQQAAYRDQLAALQRFPARRARYAELDRPLAAPVAALLRGQGIQRLYTHQAAAINAALAGESVTVVTGTASGKTLCFNVPVAERLTTVRGSRALYLYPTKALAQDQLGKLDSWAGALPLHPATYDGDTPQSERRWVRQKARVVLTNPDMLHVSILPNHTSWGGFLSHLDYVVIDEIHAYRGVFGSHVAAVLRRLRRLCEHYGSSPQFICTSATIANPGEHVRALTGVQTRVVDEDGSPTSERWFALWNPPMLSTETGERRSTLTEATWVFAELARQGMKNLTFTRARVMAELVLRYAQAALEADAAELVERVAAYRAGYTPAQRRAIEQQLFRGELLGVAATNALELGVDVGALDAVLMVGFPGTIASTWQQAGRAGRAGRASLAMLVLQDNPLDQFLARNPDALFGRGVESATTDPENPYVLLRHAACAAAEKPLGPADIPLFGEVLPELEEILVEAGQLREAGGRFFWCGSGYPAGDVSIRTSGGEPYAIRAADGDALLGTADAETAFHVVHPGAIYLHQGETYEVERLDLALRTAYVRPVEPGYYTTPRVTTSVRIVEQQADRPLGEARAGFGEVSVTTQVLGYRKHQLATEQVLEHVDLDLPERTYRTEGMWLGLSLEAGRRLESEGRDLLGALHAVEHAAIALVPLFAMCDRWDAGGASHPNHPDLFLPAVFLHDASPGGVGIADRCYQVLDRLLRQTLLTVDACPCEAGCPACIHSPTCGSRNEPLDKQGAVDLLRLLVGGEEELAPPQAGEADAATPEDAEDELCGASPVPAASEQG